MGLENRQSLPHANELESSSLTPELREALTRIYAVYGDDPEKWGNIEYMRPKCIAEVGSGFGFMEIVAALRLGTSKCPRLLAENEAAPAIRTPHSASNIVGPITAAQFPDECKLCGLKPTGYSFQKDW